MEFREHLKDEAIEELQAKIDRLQSERDQLLEAAETLSLYATCHCNNGKCSVCVALGILNSVEKGG